MANQFIGVATECLPLAGGTLEGSLNMGGSYLNMSGGGELIWNTEIFSGGWARGITFDTNKAFAAGVGCYGTDNMINSLYMGVGSAPWGGNNALKVTSSDVQFNNVSLARVNGTYSGMTVGTASNATNANYATNAGTASNAINATNASNATNAYYLVSNNEEAPTLKRFQFFQGSGYGSLFPTTDWWSSIRTQHSGYANGYWQEMAFGFTNSATNKSIKYRTNVNGTKSAWRDIPQIEKDSNGYWGFYLPENNTYFRAPTNGIIPNVQSSSGVGNVGTTSWPFLSMCAKTFVGNLSGNATSATTATNATNATNLAYFKSTSNTTVGVDDTTSNAIGYVNGIKLMSQTDGGLFKQVYSNAWAGEIYIDYRTGMLASRGKNNGTWTSWNNVVSNTLNYIVAPISGQFVTNTPLTTGALKIRLPVGFTNTMMKFTIDFYNYSTNESCTYHVAGYNYNTPSWLNVSAYSESHYNAFLSDLTVRFCNDGGVPAICIGETTTTWAYQQVVIRDVLTGYSGYSYNWQQGWNISFVTTLPTVMQTVTHPASWYHSANADSAATATNATKLGNIAAANYINTSDTLILRGMV